MPQPYDMLNKGWKATTKILFGEALGELKDYSDWLHEYLPPSARKKSHLSGKPVTLTMDYYCPTAKFVSADELKERAIAPLTINEVKDID